MSKPEKSKLNPEMVNPEIKSTKTHLPLFPPMFFNTTDPTTAAVFSSQVFTNTLWRQSLGNARLGINNGESLKDTFKRLNRPAFLFRGATSRFALQFLTQGLPTILDRSANKGVENPVRIPPSTVALWMTVLGMVLEPVNLSKPSQDKFSAVGGGTINIRSRLPAMTIATTPFILARNQFYAHAVFGNKGKPLEERMIYAGFAAAASNVLDVGVNISAYEAARAKDGTPLKEIFTNVWKSFAGTSDQTPSARLVNFAKKSVSGNIMRITGVVGATTILSPEFTNKLEVGFEQFATNLKEMWMSFQEQVSDRGGVDENSIKKDKPDTSVSGAKAAKTNDPQTKTR